MHMKVALAAVAATAAVVSGCASGGEATPTPTSSVTTAASVDPSGSGVVSEVVAVELRSEFSDLHTLGPDGRRVFGWNLLVGDSSFLGQPVQVRLQGSVEYLDGNGPFDGFLRIVAQDGSELAFYVDGQATAGDPTELPARLDFIGATGSYAAMVAAGQFEGTREAAVGAPVVTRISLIVDTDGVAGTSSVAPVAPATSADSARAAAEVTPE